MEAFDSYLLLTIIALPLIGSVAFMAIPASHDLSIRWTAVVLAGATMILSLYAFVGYDHETGGFQFIRTWPWLTLPGEWPLGGQGISLNLGIDGISALMVMLTGIVMFTGTLVSWNMSDRSKDFFILYFVLLSGVLGVFTVRDLFFLFFFYELAVLPMFLLIGIWGSNSQFSTFLRTKEYGAMKLTLYLVAGSVLIWIAIMAIFVQAGLGTFDMAAIEEVSATKFSSQFQHIFFPMLMLGFGILAGLWPFHTWSPDGHVAAPTAVSMVHAGVLMKLGAYGIIRVGLGLMPIGAEGWMPVLVGLGTVNVLYGAFSAMGQHDLKYIIGYSSVSHMGYVLMGIATLHTLGMSGAILQMFSHGIMTALFFAVVGSIYTRTHTRDSTILEGLTKRMGYTSIFFVVAGMTSLGLPGLSGFVAELLIFLGLFQTYPVLGILAIVGAAITAIYILRLIAKIFFGQLNEQWSNREDISRIEGFSCLILAGLILIVGLYPFPFIRVLELPILGILSRFVSVS